MTEWRVKVGGNVESDLIDVDVVVNANPFGNHGTAYVSDFAGTKIDSYSVGTRVDFQVREYGTNDSWTDKLNTYVVEPRQRSEVGSNMLEVSCYGLNTLLKRGDVNVDLSGQVISDALKDLIKDWTPVTWVAGNVSVIDDVPVTRSFTNERTDVILQALRRKSGDEAFGVNDSLEFFWEQGDTGTVGRGIGPTQVFDYDLPERAEEEVNEVRVNYDDGDKAVIVGDGESKRELENALGASKAVSFNESTMRQQIQTREDAIAAGEEILADRGPALTGPVTTYGLRDADPADTIEVHIPDAGIHDEYPIAQLEYAINDRVEVTIVDDENQQLKANDPYADMLVRQSDTLQRVEMRPALGDNDLTEIVRGIETNNQAKFKITGDIDGVPIAAGTVTNTGFLALRDGVINQSTVTTGDIAVGTDDTIPSRTQTSLVSESESVSSTTSTSSHNVASFEGSLTTTDSVQEVGLENGSGDLLVAAVTDEPVDSPSNAEIIVTVVDDDRVDGIVTETGQQLFRDVLADNGPTWPDKYALGSSSNALDETDTSLDTQLTSQPLGKQILVETATGSEWSDLTTWNANDDKPYHIEGGKLQHAQVAWAFDAQDDTIHDDETTGSEFTGSTAASLTGSSEDLLQFNFVSNHTTASDDLRLALRAIDNNGSSELILDWDKERKTVSISNTLEWESFSLDFERLDEGVRGITVDGATSITNDVDVDVVAVYDKSQITDISNWDNNTGGSGDYLSDPKLYPSQTDIRFGPSQEFELDRETEEMTVSSSWNDTTGSQALVVAGNVTSNSSSVTQTISQSEFVDIDLRLSRFGSRTDATPTSGFKGQTVDTITVESGLGGVYPAGVRQLDISSMVPADTINGNTVREAGALDGSSNLLTESLLADIVISSGVTISMTEHLRLRSAALPVNTVDFDPTITNQESVASADITNQAYYQIRILEWEASF